MLTQDVAYGSKDISLGDGTELAVPKVLRKVLRSEMYREFKEANTDPETGEFVRSHELGIDAAAALDATESGAGDDDPDSELDEPEVDGLQRLGTCTDGGMYTCLSPGAKQVQVPGRRAGFAMKPGGVKKPTGRGRQRVAPANKRAKFTVLQLEFLKNLYSKGAANKSNKIGPHQAQQLMMQLGTLEGQARFPDDPFWVANTVRDPRTNMPKAKFRLSELLDHWTFRPWFSKQKAQFDKQVGDALQLASQVRATSGANVGVDSSDGEDFDEEDGE